MKYVFTLLFALICSITTILAQSQGWLNAKVGLPFQELHDIKKTLDGGFVAAGGTTDFSSIIKYDNTGSVAWETILPFFGFDETASFYVNVALSVVETEDSYILAEYSNELGTPSMYSLTEISLDGEFIQRNIVEAANINKLVKNEVGELLVIENEYLNPASTRIIKYSPQLEEIWSLGLPSGSNSGFDGYAYIDENNVVQYWMLSSSLTSEVVHYEISDEGIILTEDFYPVNYSEDNLDGVIHDKLDNGNIAFVPNGGSFFDPIIREISIADPSTNGIFTKRNISQEFIKITGLQTSGNQIFVCGNTKDGDSLSTKFMVFDDELNLINRFDLNALIKEADPTALGAELYDFVIDENQNMLGVGSINYFNQGGIGSFGYFSFYLSLDGTFEILSSNKDVTNSILTVYPNPVTDFLIVDPGSKYSTNNKLSITSSMGQKVKEYSNVSFPLKLSLASFNQGTYFLVLSDGKEIITVPFVKN